MDLRSDLGQLDAVPSPEKEGCGDSLFQQT